MVMTAAAAILVLVTAAAAILVLVTAAAAILVLVTAAAAILVLVTAAAAILVLVTAAAITLLTRKMLASLKYLTIQLRRWLLRLLLDKFGRKIIAEVKLHHNRQQDHQ